jgi:hypothetical protein
MRVIQNVSSLFAPICRKYSMASGCIESCGMTFRYPVQYVPGRSKEAVVNMVEPLAINTKEQRAVVCFVARRWQMGLNSQTMRSIWDERVISTEHVVKFCVWCITPPCCLVP